MAFYTSTDISFPAVSGAAVLVYKLAAASSTASVTVTTLTDGSFVFRAPAAGTYCFQQNDQDGNVLATGRFVVNQSLADAPAGYDPRSEAEKALEAIEAKIAGRILTLEQSQITIGDRSIQYINSITELERWRTHYQQIVNRENGIYDCKTEVCILRRV